MRIIKVNAINSTNNFARDFYRGNSDFEPVCVVAFEQTKGRGQRGASWVSKPGENLTFSVLYPKLNISINHRFLLSAAVSLAILEALKEFEVSDLSVKWPNDIMSGRFKIGGILIENILNSEGISASIIGIGLNVNQQEFSGLPKAGSLKKVTGKNFDLDEVLSKILKKIDLRLKSISSENETLVLEEYASMMFKRDVVSTFQLPDKSYLTGVIRGVTTSGLLNIEVEDSVFRTFDLKEVKLMF